jgi:hypothetical protein
MSFYNATCIFIVCCVSAARSPVRNLQHRHTNQTHFHRSSTLGLAVSVKDGAVFPKVTAIKQGESCGIDFGYSRFRPHVSHFSSDLWVNRRHFGALSDSSPRCQTTRRPKP